MDLDSLGVGAGSMAYVNEGPKVSVGRLNQDVAGLWILETGGTDDRACMSNAHMG